MIWTHYVILADLKVAILRPQPSECLIISMYHHTQLESYVSKFNSFGSINDRKEHTEPTFASCTDRKPFKFCHVNFDMCSHVFSLSNWLRTAMNVWTATTQKTRSFVFFSFQTSFLCLLSFYINSNIFSLLNWAVHVCRSWLCSVGSMLVYHAQSPGLSPQHHRSQAWWYVSITTALRSWVEENKKFKLT